MNIIDACVMYYVLYYILALKIITYTHALLDSVMQSKMHVFPTYLLAEEMNFIDFIYSYSTLLCTLRQWPPLLDKV
jgi:hypothetical protein